MEDLQKRLASRTHRLHINVATLILWRHGQFEGVLFPREIVDKCKDADYKEKYYQNRSIILAFATRNYLVIWAGFLYLQRLARTYF